VGFKLAEGKGLREGRHSKELWKSVEKVKDGITRDLVVTRRGDGKSQQPLDRRLRRPAREPFCSQLSHLFLNI